MRHCVWPNCRRPRKDYGKHKGTLCDMHQVRRQRGKDMEAPPRYSKVRRLRFRALLYLQGGREALLRLLAGTPKSKMELARALGVSHGTTHAWLARLEAEGIYLETVAFKHPVRQRPSFRFYLFNGTEYPDEVEVDIDGDGDGEEPGAPATRDSLAAG